MALSTRTGLRAAAIAVVAGVLAGGGFWVGRATAPVRIPDGYIDVSALPPAGREMVSNPGTIAFLAKIIHVENGQVKLYDTSKDSPDKAMPAGYPAWPGAVPLLTPKPGMSWPDVSVTGGEGLPAAKDKWVIVDLWALWCASCLEEMPDLNALAGALPTDRAAVFVVNADPTRKDSAAQVNQLFSGKGYTHLAPLMAEGHVVGDMLVSAGMSPDFATYPMALIYAPGGKPFGYLIGAPGWAKPEMIDFIRKLSALPAPPA